MDLKPYLAKDRRCYNGVPCDDLAKEWKHTDELEKLLKTLNKTASVTYFPVEGKFLAFTNGNILENPDLVGPPVMLTGNFHASKQEALIEAIKHIAKGETL